MNKLPLLFIAMSALPSYCQVTASSASWPDIQVLFKAKVEPPMEPSVVDPAALQQFQRDVHGGVIVDDRVHRYWQDPLHKAYLGYDLSIKLGSNVRAIQLQISALSLTPQQMVKHGFPATWARLSLPKYPVIPEVRIGDTVAIDLMINPTTGQKVVDYLTFQHTRPQSAINPRDFSLSDVELFVNQPQVSINGKLVKATAHIPTGISGSTVWFYLQGQGRFVLSLIKKQDTPLKRVGEVSGSTLTFRDNSDSFRIECTAQIVPSPGHYNIYVFHDRTWRPSDWDAREPFIFGSAPLETLVRP